MMRGHELFGFVVVQGLVGFVVESGLRVQAVVLTVHLSAIAI